MYVTKWVPDSACKHIKYTTELRDENKDPAVICCNKAAELS